MTATLAKARADLAPSVAEILYSLAMMAHKSNRVETVRAELPYYTDRILALFGEKGGE